jgi:hypothetical protein
MQLRTFLLTAMIAALFTCSLSQAQQPASAGSPATAAIIPGPITKPVIIEIAPGTYFINEFGMNAMYLVVGEKRALVIDAGTGFCDFKGIIENLTKLPYDVAITHAHPDHVGGVGQFDEIYIHPLDSASTHISYEQRVQYGEIMRNMNIGYKNVWGYTNADAVKYTKQPKIKVLSDGRYSIWVAAKLPSISHLDIHLENAPSWMTKAGFSFPVMQPMVTWAHAFL